MAAISRAPEVGAEAVDLGQIERRQHQRETRAVGPFEEYVAEILRNRLADIWNVHPGEKIGYVITDAKAKIPADRVSAGGIRDKVRYDRQEYLKKLKAAVAEVIGDAAVESVRKPFVQFKPGDLCIAPQHEWEFRLVAFGLP